MEACYTCYFCMASIHSNKHYCGRECWVAGKVVIHKDFCPRCRKIILKPLVEFFRGYNGK